MNSGYLKGLNVQNFSYFICLQVFQRGNIALFSFKKRKRNNKEQIERI